jgi:hypothetical protein
LVSIPDAFYPKIPVFAISIDFLLDLKTIIEGDVLAMKNRHGKVHWLPKVRRGCIMEQSKE